MSKLLKQIIILIVFILLIRENVYAVTPTLAEIANKFNNSSIVDNYENAGGNITAAHDIDSLNITIKAEGETQDIELLLEENILSIEIDQTDSLAIAKMYVASNIIDIIGQLHGYAEGELLQTINSEEVKNYTLIREGFEIENITETKLKIKSDITKKIPLVNLSNKYIEVTDLENLKEYISGDGSAEKSKGNVWFNKSGYDGENTLLIAEKDNLTENSYKSILSIIEVMFDSRKASDYFKTNYSEISDANKEFTGFKIEINPTKTEFEEQLIPTDSGYKFARITINKSLANSVIDGVNNKNSENEEDKKSENSNNINKDNKNTIKEQNNKINSEELPKTGLNNIDIQIISIIVTILISVAFYKKYKDIK